MKNDEDLLASMSHELRTPLNAILGWVQLLRAGGGCGPDADRALEIIERNAKQQAKAVDDAIDLARIANGSLPMLRKSTRWSEGLRAALAGNETSAAARGVNLEVEESDTALRVVGDPGRLTQIAKGLIASAVKRSIPGGTVRITLAVEGTSAVLAVSEDHGDGEDGAPPARNTGRHRRMALIGDGRGLSVSVARGLLRLHGGTLEEDDGGRTLVARIPLAGTAGSRATSEASGNAPAGAAPAPAM